MGQFVNQVGLVHIDVTVFYELVKTLDAYRIFHNVAAFNSSHANHADANIIQIRNFLKRTNDYLRF